MPEDLMTTMEGSAPTDGGAPLVPGGNPAATSGTPPAGGMTGGEPQTMQVPTSAMKRIKDEQYAKGRQEALRALAEGAGYGSADELTRALAGLRKPAAPTPAPRQAAPAADPNDDVSQQELIQSKQERRAQGRFERMLEKTTRERDNYAQRYKQTEAQMKALQTKLDEKDAEVSLRQTAVEVGLKDVDYGLRLFFRELENMDEAKLETFSERAFFEGLRATKPYLFGETVRPATTGTGTGGAATAPKPGAVSTTAAQGAQVDVRKMNPKEYEEHMRKRGLNAHM